MSTEIDEALYVWQKGGWTVAEMKDGQYTLTHKDARPVVCGARTTFQTVGAIRGEMRRALEQGPLPVKLPETQDAPPRQRRRVRRHKSTPGSDTAAKPPQERPRAAVVSPYATARRRPNPVVDEPERNSRPIPLFNAAFELAKLNALAAGSGPDVFPALWRRYKTDETYRTKVIAVFQRTPQAAIEQLREQFAEIDISHQQT